MTIQNRYVFKASIISALSIVFLLSAACSDSFIAQSTGASTISGVASAGPINSATVTAYTLNADGSTGAQLDSTVSDSSGKFSLNVSNAGPLVIVVAGGSYVEEASGATVVLGKAQLRTALASVSDLQKVAVTPVTEIAAQSAIATIAANPAAKIETIISISNTKVAAAMGLSDITKPPANPNLAAINAPNSESAQYAVVLATVSQLAKNAGQANGTTVNSLDIAQALATTFTYNGSFASNVGSTDVPVPNAAGSTLSLNSVLGGASNFSSAMQVAQNTVVQTMPADFRDPLLVPSVTFVTAPAAPSGSPVVIAPSAPAALPWVQPTVSGPPPGPGASTPAVAEMSYTGQSSVNLVGTPVWTQGAPVPVALNYMASVPLRDGRSLLASAGTSRVYDSVANSWTDSHSVVSPGFSTLVSMSDGRAMILGGSDGASNDNADVQIYDPLKNTWSSVAPLPEASAWVTPTVLKNGNVLILGESLPAVYNGSSWSQTPAMSTLRYDSGLVTLNNGKALAFGGYIVGGNKTSTAELYNPATNSWSAAPSLATAASGIQTVLLKNGNVLGVGGLVGPYSSDHATSAAEIYDSSTSTWTTSVPSMSNARDRHRIALLPDGDVIVTGGLDAQLNDVAQTEIFSALNSTWSNGPALHIARSYHALSVTPDGKIIVQGGFTGGSTWESSTEVFDLYPTKVTLSVSGGVAPFQYSIVSGPGFIRGATYYSRQTGTAQIKVTDSQGRQKIFNVSVQ